MDIKEADQAFIAAARDAVPMLIAALKVERAERRRLAELIDDTAKHWLDLQAKYPIRWEGAIDNAMQAACSEILQLLDLVAGSGRKILECAQLQLRAEDAEAALRESRQEVAELKRMLWPPQMNEVTVPIESGLKDTQP